jgi:porin
MKRSALLALLLFAPQLPAQDMVEFLEEQQLDYKPSPPETPWWEWDAATGSWFGARTSLQDRGIEFFGGYNYTLQSAINISGAEGSAMIYSGMLDYGLQLDLEKLVGWTGASVQTTWMWISGNTVEESIQDNLLISSDLAGFNTFRMLDLWFQQNLFEDRISLRVGQFTADTEFVRTAYSGQFLNRSLGWPALLAMNLPGGGPSVPLATLGIRLALRQTDWLTLQSAIFQGNVYNQEANPHGFRWNLNAANGFFLLTEAQMRWNHRESEAGLPGQFKIGFWTITGDGADPLAASTNSPNYGGYLLMDQMLYREPTLADGKAQPSSLKSSQGLGWFGRIGFAPPDRNIVDFYFDTGFVYTGLLPTRDFDVLGLALAYGQISTAASRIPTFRDSYGDGTQCVIELTYQAQLTPWMTIQPDIQFIISPRSHLNFDNAIILGGSVNIRF